MIISVPYIFPFICEVILKCLIWPYDLKYFNFKCSLKSGFPDYQSNCQKNANDQLHIVN
jgi:hypothetical protein